MTDLPLSVWALVVAALVVGILAGHFGWGRRWPGSLGKLHPDYLTGLDYLVTEQPDRALDMFLKLMDANADTIETHFALGTLYRRRGEVERAIRIHQNLLARDVLAPEHREQALLALAQAEKYRGTECGVAGRNFYWHCPACHSWDSFEAYAIVKLR